MGINGPSSRGNNVSQGVTRDSRSGIDPSRRIRLAPNAWKEIMHRVRNILIIFPSLVTHTSKKLVEMFISPFAYSFIYPLIYLFIFRLSEKQKTVGKLRAVPSALIIPLGRKKFPDEREVAKGLKNCASFLFKFQRPRLRKCNSERWKFGYIACDDNDVYSKPLCATNISGMSESNAKRMLTLSLIPMWRCFANN